VLCRASEEGTSSSSSDVSSSGFTASNASAKFLRNSARFCRKVVGRVVGRGDK
jgi:hypothetical protein